MFLATIGKQLHAQAQAQNRPLTHEYMVSDRFVDVRRAELLDGRPKRTYSWQDEKIGSIHTIRIRYHTRSCADDPKGVLD